MLLSRIPKASSTYSQPLINPVVNNSKKAVIQTVDELFTKIADEQRGKRWDKDGFRLVRSKKNCRQLIKATNIFWSCHAGSKKFIRRIIHVLRTQDDPEALQRVLLLACENQDPKTLEQFFSLLVELQNWEALGFLFSKITSTQSCLSESLLGQLCGSGVLPHVSTKQALNCRKRNSLYGQVAAVEYLCQHGEYEDAFLVAGSAGQRASMQSLKMVLLDEDEQKFKVSVPAVLLLVNRCTVENKRYFFKKLDAELNWDNWLKVLNKLSVKTLAALYFGLHFTDHTNLGLLEEYLITRNSCCSILKVLPNNRVQRLARFTGDRYRQKMQSDWEPCFYAFLIPESAQASVQKVWQALIGRAPTKVESAEEFMQLIDTSCKVIAETKNEGLLSEIHRLRKCYQDYIFVAELELHPYFRELVSDASGAVLPDEKFPLLMTSLGKALIADELLKCLAFSPKEFKNNCVARYAAYFLLDGMGSEIDRELEEGINSQWVLPHFQALFRSCQSVDSTMCERIFSVFNQANEARAWRLAIDYVSDTSESLKHVLEKLYLEWVGQRISSLTTVGERTIIPVGWSAKGTAHIIYALVTRQSLHQVEEALVNSGAGITGNHAEVTWEFCERKISEVAVVHRSSLKNIIEHMESLLPLKASGVLDTLAASNLQSADTIAVQRHYAYWENLENAARLPCQVYGASQIGGSCSVEAPKRVVRYLLNPTDYKLWGTEAKLLVAAVWFNMLNQMGLGNEVKSVIRKLLIKNYYARLVYSSQPIKKAINILSVILNFRQPVMGRLVEAALNRAVREVSKFDLAFLVRTVLFREPLVALEMIDRIVDSGRQKDAVLNAVFIWNNLYSKLIEQKDKAIRASLVQWLQSVGTVPQACILAWRQYAKKQNWQNKAKRKLINSLLKESDFPVLTTSSTSALPQHRKSAKRKRQPLSEFRPNRSQSSKSQKITKE